MSVYGYIRVSTKDQNEDRQLLSLSEFNIPKNCLFIDKCSGKDFKRPSYKRMIRKLQFGDLVLIKSIDRLGRNYEEIIEQWRIITKEKGADIKVLDMPLLDTTYGKDLLGTFIADLVLQIMSFTAQLERDNIRQRQREGIEAAKPRGVQFGRPPIQIPEEFYPLKVQYKMGDISLRKAAKVLNISHSTFSKWVSQDNHL